MTSNVRGLRKLNRKNLLALFLILIACSACSERFDAYKFKQVKMTAEAVNASAKSAADYEECRTLVEKLSAEISALKGKMESAKERGILQRYSELLTIYQDGLLLWKFKIEGGHYKFIPAGVIYVGQELEPVVEKYRFEVKPNVYRPTGQVWKSIPEGSIRAVWTNADSQITLIKYLTDN